jgi:hypothetical protein
MPRPTLKIFPLIFPIYGVRISLALAPLHGLRSRVHKRGGYIHHVRFFLAEDERQRIIKRTHEGRQIERAKGVTMGRKPKLTAHQMKEARQWLIEER